MTPLGLTPKQRALLTFLEQRLETSRVSPSFEQMRKHLGLGSKSGVFRLVEALEERGHIVRKPNCPHSIALAKPGDQSPKIQSLDQGLRVQLPPILSRRLLAYCSKRGTSPGAVIGQALAAHIAGGRP